MASFEFIDILLSGLFALAPDSSTRTRFSSPGTARACAEAESDLHCLDPLQPGAADRPSVVHLVRDTSRWMESGKGDAIDAQWPRRQARQSARPDIAGHVGKK
ncbi:hypothetical protein [Accumulibacter sp.]|uniref:hypothetical protein n=1 Tax=Accumulibacter sp. TaxID=2053492 RepID=UPI0025E19D1B|nr:hypothetical protein [Accumulibacter sp.]MCM8594552.1 hypothetical protein [Accumulibacter sp.]MCM8627400.1 hypothetical protein [Accumulibacter sp.]MDS4048698.1 hypothetical protein [Accumulibacter sp.]